MNTKQLTLAMIVSKNIVVDSSGKEWLIESFSDSQDPDKDWYNVYDYDVVLAGDDWVPYFQEGYDNVQMIDMFEGTDFAKEKRPVMTKENLYFELIRNNFKSNQFN